MKSKKLALPVIILAVAILATAVYSVVSSIAQKPTITEQEFPFSITYELNGETVTINDVYAVRYSGNGGYTDTKNRIYTGKIGALEENTTYWIIQQDKDGRIELNTNFYPDYLMGDPEYDYFDYEVFEPQIFYYDSEEIEYADEETLTAQGVKLISWEYPAPIENSFVFSHISILNSAVVFPALLIGALALAATLIFVKKDADFVRKPMDMVSTVLNFVIGVAVIPFSTICAILLDAMGDNESIFNQVFYFIPALTVLGITASVALRRRGYGKSALIVEFAGPAVLALVLIVCAALGLL